MEGHLDAHESDARSLVRRPARRLSRRGHTDELPSRRFAASRPQIQYDRQRRCANYDVICFGPGESINRGMHRENHWWMPLWPGAVFCGHGTRFRRRLSLQELSEASRHRFFGGRRSSEIRSVNSGSRQDVPRHWRQRSAGPTKLLPGVRITGHNRCISDARTGISQGRYSRRH
jgi:hypothetical protein